MRPVVLLAAFLAAGCDPGRPRSSASPASSSIVEHGSAAAASSAKVARAAISCTSDPGYPEMWQLAEASAAVEFEPRPGERAIIALADSGNHGEAMIWPISPPGALRPVKLELDTLASDDIEGAACTRGHLYTLTSSGAVRRYTPSAAGELVRDRAAYAIGPRPYTCDTLWDGNCGKNLEGLCLRPAPASAPASTKPPCAGYAASKTESALYCVAFLGDALTIDTKRSPIKLDLAPQALSDCAFGSAGGAAEGTLVVTTNIYGGSTTYAVDEATGAVSAIDVPGLLNNEAVVIDRDGALYLFMDGNTSISPTFRQTCTGWGPGPTSKR